MPFPVEIAGVLPPPEAYEVATETTSVAGGLRVVLAPDPSRRELVAEWIFDNGARDDPPGQAGLAHLAEHLSFGVIAPGSADYDHRLGALGGESHGWTDRERSGLGATVPADDRNFDGLLALEAQRWSGLVIDEASVARQHRVLAAESAEALSAAHALDKFTLDNLLWGPGSAWSRHPQAPVAPSLRAADVLAEWPRLRDPRRSVLVLAGDMPVDAAARVRAAFAAAPTEDAPLDTGARDAEVEPCEAGPASRSWTRDNVAQGEAYFAWPGPARDHGERVAVEAIARWLGGTRVTAGRDCGAVVFQRGGGALRAGEHAARLRRTLAALSAGGLPAPALEAARAGQLTDLARARGSLALRARIVAGCVVSSGNADCLRTEAVAWTRLSVEQTRRAAARWLDWSSVTVLVVLPRSTLLPPPVPGIRLRR